ncbi:MAG TPA: type II CAAX endopeptidase family protein [Bryobacteraceae bacterium]|nr:type II CAAX endopeptidase family protein [Bryobacteraceae bacterium]
MIRFRRLPMGDALQIAVPSARRERVLELLVFLFLILPSMSLSFLLIHQGNLSFGITAVATILRDLALVSLIAFFLWHNGEPKARIGWRFTGVGDILRGIAYFVVVFYAAGYLDRLLTAAGFSSPKTQLPKFLTAQGSMQELLAVILVIVVAVAEETIFRGYLILRLREVTGSTFWAVVLSSVIFAAGHGYEGSAGVVTVGFLGLTFAIVYVWRGSLVAPIVMQFLQDFLAIVVLPLVLHK